MFGCFGAKSVPFFLGLLIALFTLYVNHSATFQRCLPTKFSCPSSNGQTANEEQDASKPVETTQKPTGFMARPETQPDPDWVTVLYWTEWFGGPWSDHFGYEDELEEIGCPEYRCYFTYDRDNLERADFVFFTSMFNPDDMPPGKGQPHQHWVYSVDESPVRKRISTNHSRYFDVVQSYTLEADLPGYNGYFVPINRTAWPSGSNEMDPASDVFKSYMTALKEGKTLHNLLQDVPQEHQKRLEVFTETFEAKIKVAALMTSHCPVQSGRLSLVNKLNKFLVQEVDVYGSCGCVACKNRHPTEPWCWQNLLAPNYLFYFAMENSLCDEYITEKLYNPLLYGLVPVVYGGANYSQYLPPHSFIDVQQHTPQQLADLLQRISEDKEEYSRYHLWRAFWEPVVGGNVCATCRALHRLNGTVPRPREDIDLERELQEPCHLPDSPSWFPENTATETKGDRYN